MKRARPRNRLAPAVPTWRLAFAAPANPFALTNLPVNPGESFHLYAAEWDTASIRFYVNDERVLTVPSSDWFSHPAGQEQPVDNPHAPFDVPFYLVISNTVGSWALETWPDHQVHDTTVFPTEFVVDYLRVYECRPPSGSDTLGPGQGCETPCHLAHQSIDSCGQ
ncbi:MAG: family 16 glycosylhydrolase [Acidimicrobiaceae bacterium]|nr:family 16 glycosylhydrolase [Acidimicrobiaceae bacterium]